MKLFGTVTLDVICNQHGTKMNQRVVVPKDAYLLVAEDLDYYYLAKANGPVSKAKWESERSTNARASKS